MSAATSDGSLVNSGAAREVTIKDGKGQKVKRVTMHLCCILLTINLSIMYAWSCSLILGPDVENYIHRFKTKIVYLHSNRNIQTRHSHQIYRALGMHCSVLYMSDNFKLCTIYVQKSSLHYKPYVDINTTTCKLV